MEESNKSNKRVNATLNHHHKMLASKESLIDYLIEKNIIGIIDRIKEYCHYFSDNIYPVTSYNIVHERF